MKIAINLILFALVNSKAYTQADYIEWKKGVKIAWSDFKGKADVRSPFGSMAAVGIYYKYNSISNGKVYKIRFTITARLDRTKSWSKSSAKTTAILKHEQLHFDIAEVVSRSFKKEAEQRVYSKDYKNEINRIFNKYTDALQKFQRKYDEQTLHSNNKVKQIEREKLIHQELLR